HLADAARRYQCVRNVRERANSIESGLRNLPDHEHLDGADLTHGNADFDPGDLTHAAFNELLRLPESRSTHLKRPNLLNHYRTVAIDFELDGLIDPAPDVNVQLVVRPHNVVVANGDIPGGSKGRNLGCE